MEHGVDSKVQKQIRDWRRQIAGESVEPYQETSAVAMDVTDGDKVGEEVDWARDDIDAVEVTANVAIQDMVNIEIQAATEELEEEAGTDAEEVSSDYSSPNELDVEIEDYLLDSEEERYCSSNDESDDDS